MAINKDHGVLLFHCSQGESEQETLFFKKRDGLFFFFFASVSLNVCSRLPSASLK